MSMRLYRPHPRPLWLRPLGSPLPSAVAAPSGDFNEEFIGPFDSWLNAVDDYGADNTGASDASADLQTALDALSDTGPRVLYLPAGTYRIDTKLYLDHRIFVAVIGADPATTTLLWNGASAGSANSCILELDSVAYSRIGRLTFDGDLDCDHCVLQAFDNTNPHFDTGNEYHDCVFQDANYGIRGGNSGFGYAETTIRRCSFLRLDVGSQLENFNALDIWHWECVFDACGYGVTNVDGAGNFHVYHCQFSGSTIADIAIGNTGYLAFRYNWSEGSQQFFNASLSGNPSLTVIANNTILDTVDDVAIYINNQGPVYMADNVIRSLDAATSPIMVMDNADSEIIAIDNTFTESSPFQFDDRNVEINTSVVTRASLLSLTAPTLPPTPLNMNRTVYDVAASSSAATIQTAIDNAVAAGNRAIVHLAGSCSVNATLTIPANANIHFCGDTQGTVLSWTGSVPGGPVISIAGPVRATLQDFQVDPNGVIGIQATGMDQAAGSRVILRKCLATGNSTYNFWFQDVGGCRAEMSDCVHVACPWESVYVNGTGTVVLWCGASGNNEQSINMENGPTVIYREHWYEVGAGDGPGWLDLSGETGTLIVEVNFTATVRLQTQRSHIIDAHTGAVTFLCCHLHDRILVSGSSANADVLALGSMGEDRSSDCPDFWSDTSSPAADARRLLCRQHDPAIGSTALSDVGTINNTFIQTMLAPTRSISPSPLIARASNVTDLRLVRIRVEGGDVGFYIDGAT